MSGGGRKRPFRKTRAVGRFVAGRDLDGQHRTDAGWTRPGRSVHTGTGHASRWAHLPHYKRAAVRLAALGTAGATSIGAVLAPAATAATWQTVAWSGGGWAAYAIGEGTYRYSHRRAWVQPVANTLGSVVGWPATKSAQEWVEVPRGHREDPEKVVRLRLAPGLALTDALKKKIVVLAKPLLGMHGALENFIPGPEPVLELRSCPAPPALVNLGHAEEYLKKASWNELFLGLTARARAVWISLAGDSPHLLASYGSGGGKSVLGKALAAQFRRAGGQVVIVDCVKRGASHKWAKGVDGITVLRSPAAAHDALIALAEEVSARCELAWHGGEIDRTPVMLVMEESNATANMLQAYWSNELEGKKKSPALIALADVLCVGREAKTHVVTFAQQATAQATGGGAARENYGVRLLSRFTRNTAKMLAPELAPHFPASSRHPGRAQVVIAGEATEVQTVYLTDEEAVEWALGGVPAGSVPVSLLGESPAYSMRKETDDPMTAKVLALVPRGHAPLADEPELPEADPLVSLAEAGDGMVVEASAAALKKARATDPSFPAKRGQKGQTHLYRPGELRAWEKNRVGTGVAR